VCLDTTTKQHWREILSSQLSKWFTCQHRRGPFSIALCLDDSPCSLAQLLTALFLLFTFCSILQELQFVNHWCKSLRKKVSIFLGRAMELKALTFFWSLFHYSSTKIVNKFFLASM
jgi:hypothetical protein